MCLLPQLCYNFYKIQDQRMTRHNVMIHVYTYVVLACAVGKCQRKAVLLLCSGIKSWKAASAGSNARSNQSS